MMKIRLQHLLTLGLGLSLGFTSCDNSPSSVDKESIAAHTSGALSIAADESIKPLMVQEINVFDSSYPNSKITATYVAEGEAIKKLFAGESNMVVISRDLSAEEIKSLESKNIFVKSVPIARDGIVVVVNNKSQDSLMTEGIIQNILTGKYSRKYKVVLDNKNGSIARFVTDSILKGAPISENIFAANNSDEVVKYVAENEDAIGFVGITQAFDPTANEGYGTFKKEVKVVSIKNDSLNKFVLPYEYSIAMRYYPYYRGIYFIYRIESKQAVGFTNFVTSEPGQLIIQKKRLMPLATSLEFKPVEIKP